MLSGFYKHLSLSRRGGGGQGGRGSEKEGRRLYILACPRNSRAMKGGGGNQRWPETNRGSEKEGRRRTSRASFALVSRGIEAAATRVLSAYLSSRKIRQGGQGGSEKERRRRRGRGSLFMCTGPRGCGSACTLR